MQIKFFNRSVSNTDKIGRFLSSNYGLSRSSAVRICRQIGLLYSDTFDILSSSKKDFLESFLSSIFLGIDLQRFVQNKITDKIRQAGYTGLRISQNLPSRGQRTKTNSQTVKRKTRRMNLKIKSKHKLN
jgi:small subunit ribosomal protein S13